MRTPPVLLLPGLLALLLSGTGCGPESPDDEPPEGRPLLLEGVGNCSFPVTTTSERAQAFVNQGICMIHGFWYYEAWRSFREAARLDSTCAMAYWGMYQSLVRHNSDPPARIRALRRAQDLIATVTPRERGYIRAGTLLETEPPERRRAGFVREMQRLAWEFPDDVEAVLFLARFLMPGFDFERPRLPGEPDLEQMLLRLMESHPEHFAPHHYFVHLVEAEYPERGLASVRVLEKLVWAAGHLVHMPGHVYYRLGEYEKARRSFIASMRVDSTYMADQQVPISRVWNYVHNLNYLLANCAEEGRYRESLEWARRLEEVPLVPRRPFFFYQGRMALPRLHMRFGSWSRAAGELAAIAANDTVRDTFAGEYARAMEAFSLGMAHLDEGDIAAAEERLRQFPATDDPGSNGGNDPYDAPRRRRLLNVARLDMQGNIHRARGEYELSFRILGAAQDSLEALGYDEPPLYARPVLESLAQAHFEAGDWEQAAELFEEVLTRRPNSGFALYGLAQALDRAGDQERAARAYRAFFEGWHDADQELEAVQRARDWLARQ